MLIRRVKNIIAALDLTVQNYVADIFLVHGVKMLWRMFDIFRDVKIQINLCRYKIKE